MTGRTASRPVARGSKRPDFTAINPNGRTEGHEYVARNPRRCDRHHGSFKINLRTGKWADFACDARGGDPVSLSAYLSGLSQTEAARRLSTMLGMTPGRNHAS